MITYKGTIRDIDEQIAEAKRFIKRAEALKRRLALATATAETLGISGCKERAALERARLDLRTLSPIYIHAEYDK